MCRGCDQEAIINRLLPGNTRIPLLITHLPNLTSKTNFTYVKLQVILVFMWFTRHGILPQASACMNRMFVARFVLH